MPHQYHAKITWTGNRGEGTANYRSYERSHTIEIDGKQLIEGSADPAFRGDKLKYNPEDLLLVSLASCHMLSYLHVCVQAGIIVTAYSDNAVGTMELTQDGGGRFTHVELHPRVVIDDAVMIAKANELHHLAHKKCFIAASVNFEVVTLPVCTAE